MTASDDDIRKYLLLMIENHGDIECLSFMQIREELELKLQLPPKSLKTKKEFILKIVSDLKNVRDNNDFEPKSKKRKKKASDESESNSQKLRTGKYSESESKKILTGVQNYLKRNNLQSGDLFKNRGTEKESGRYSETSELWDELYHSIPGRSKHVVLNFYFSSTLTFTKAIYQHARRLMTADTQVGVWTPVEIKKLMNLVKIHGNNWVAIGQNLNKFSEDCRDAFRRQEPRKVTGVLTAEEEVRLIHAVRTVANCDESVHPMDIPVKGISWLVVRSLMDNERHDLDYLRKWQTVLNRSCRISKAPFEKSQDISSSGDKERKRTHDLTIDNKNNPSALSGTSSSSVTKVESSDSKAQSEVEKLKSTLLLLRSIESFEASDPSEVIWSEVNRAANVFNAHDLFKRLVKQLPNPSRDFATNMNKLLAKYNDKLKVCSFNLDSSSSPRKINENADIIVENNVKVKNEKATLEVSTKISNATKTKTQKILADSKKDDDNNSKSVLASQKRSIGEEGEHSVAISGSGSVPVPAKRQKAEIATPHLADANSGSGSGSGYMVGDGSAHVVLNEGNTVQKALSSPAQCEILMVQNPNENDELHATESRESGGDDDGRADGGGQREKLERKLRKAERKKRRELRIERRRVRALALDQSRNAADV